MLIPRKRLSFGSEHSNTRGILNFRALGSIYSTYSSGAEQHLKHRSYVKFNEVKNPNWLEANQLALFQIGLQISIQDYREEVQLAVRVGLNLGPPNCKSSVLTPRSRCLHKVQRDFCLLRINVLVVDF